MESKEIIGLMFFAFALIFTVGMLWRLKQQTTQRNAWLENRRKIDLEMEKRKLAVIKEIKGNLERNKLRQHPNYGHPDFDPLNPNVLKSRESVSAQKKRYSQTQTVGSNSVGIQSQGSTTVVHDSSSDLLNAALMWSMMNNNNSRQVSRTDDDTGYVSMPKSEPREESSSSYSSSYSSSSSDDSSSRSSSYSSSYSSSSSDDSYSSSSSDSSYSSSFSSD